MARVIGPFLSQKAKGSIGGITAASWKGMAVVRRIPIPSRRRRSTQPANRSLIGFLSRQYGTLGGADRVLWEQYALDHPQDDGFGGTFIMSGQNAYVMLNHTAVRLGLIGKLQTSPPTNPPPATITGLSVVTGATDPGDIDLTWTPDGTPVDTDYNEYRIAGPFQSPARQEVHSRFKYLGKATGVTSMLTLSGLIEGTWYWVNIRYVDEYGQKTAWLTGQATPKLTV